MRDILGDFDINMYLLTQAGIPTYRLTRQKKNFSLSGFYRLSGPQSENKRKRKDNYLYLARELKTMDHEGDDDINHIWYAWNSPKRPWEKTPEKIEIRGRIEIIQSTELLRSARLLWRILETGWDLQSFRLLWKTTYYHCASSGGSTGYDHERDRKTHINKIAGSITQYKIFLKITISRTGQLFRRV